MEKKSELLRNECLANKRFSDKTIHCIQGETVNACDIHKLMGHYGAPTEEEKVLIHALREVSQFGLNHFYLSEDKDCVRTEVFICFYRSEKLFSLYERIYHIDLRLLADELIESFYEVHETLYEFNAYMDSDEIEIGNDDEFIHQV